MHPEKIIPGKPPPKVVDVPLVQKIDDFYKFVYRFSKTLPKPERFGIGATLQNHALNAWLLVISSALEIKMEKLSLLKKLRIEVELLKRILRIMQELKILETKIYFTGEAKLQEISRMANGWIKYLEK